MDKLLDDQITRESPSLCPWVKQLLQAKGMLVTPLRVCALHATTMSLSSVRTTFLWGRPGGRSGFLVVGNRNQGWLTLAKKQFGGMEEVYRMESKTERIRPRNWRCRARVERWEADGTASWSFLVTRHWVKSSGVQILTAGQSLWWVWILRPPSWRCNQQFP